MLTQLTQAHLSHSAALAADVREMASRAARTGDRYDRACANRLVNQAVRDVVADATAAGLLRLLRARSELAAAVLGDAAQGT